MTKKEIKKDASDVDLGWWYTTVPKYHRDRLFFGNPIIWNKLVRVFNDKNK